MKKDEKESECAQMVKDKNKHPTDLVLKKKFKKSIKLRIGIDSVHQSSLLMRKQTQELTSLSFS